MNVDSAVSRFHNTDSTFYEYCQGSVNRALSSGRINEDDAQLVNEFLSEVQSTEHISATRAFKLYSNLLQWRNHIGPYRENGITDIHSGIAKLKITRRENGRPYAQNTIRDLVLILKRFYLWMIENGYTQIEEKKLRKIRPPATNTMTKTAEQILTEDEVKAIMKECRIARDRAIIAVLYEGGFRIGEIGNLKWDQVKFNQWNVVINVNNKTGKPRYIPLVMARPYLAQWRNDYPFDPSGSSYVFLTNNEHKQLQYRGIAKQIAILAKRAGIEKHITPHIFRHSRITHLIRQGYNESIIKKMIWGDITTTMFATYAHLTDADIEREIAVKQGIVTEARKKEASIEPRQCPICYTINGPTQDYCGSCGIELTEEARQRSQMIDKKLEEHPLYKEIVAILPGLVERELQRRLANEMHK